jgi:hypothetical protein
MASQTSGPLSERPGSPDRQTEDPVVESQRRILCGVCRTGYLKLDMCGPRVRGRCQSCRTVWVFLWSCVKRGWFQWSN